MATRDPEEFIRFPDELPPVTPRVQTPPALKFITSLLYKSGTGLSLVYILLILVIQPLLEVQYERRGDYLKHTLKKCRSLLVFLGKQHKRLPTVAVKRGNKLYSDAQCQTISDEDEDQKDVDPHSHFGNGSVYFQDQKDEVEEKTEKNLVNNKLTQLRDAVDHYNQNCCDYNELYPFNFQMKKLQGRIDAYSHVQLFRGSDRNAIAGKSAGEDIRKEIRTIKGWYLTGQV